MVKIIPASKKSKKDIVSKKIVKQKSVKYKHIIKKQTENSKKLKLSKKTNSIKSLKKTLGLSSSKSVKSLNLKSIAKTKLKNTKSVTSSKSFKLNDIKSIKKNEDLLPKYPLIIIYTDGGSRGNPGNSASAYIITDETGKTINEYSEFIGVNTNNVAEYTALIRALDFARELKPDEVVCYSDSEVMIKQINGEYKINAEHLKKLCQEIHKLSSKFNKIGFANVRRTHPFIQKADELVNNCLDRANKNPYNSYPVRDL